jgi:colicin import membrane protein
MKVFEAPKFTHPSFSAFLRRSTYVHAFLILCTLLGGKVAYDLEQKTRDANLQLIQASVRVDMVAMPTNTLNELKNLSSGVEEAKPETPEVVKEAAKVETKVEPKEEPKVVDKTPDTSPAFEEAAQAKKRQDFLSKLKTLGNKKVDSKGEQKAEKGLNGEKTSAIKNLVLSGNKLSKGTSIYGEGAGRDMTALQIYVSRLPEFVRPNWNIPTYLSGKNLTAQVQIWLNINGEVTRAVVRKSSGESEFDQRALEAIKAARFPPLKEEFAARAQSDGVLLGFPL